MNMDDTEVTAIQGTKLKRFNPAEGSDSEYTMTNAKGGDKHITGVDLTAASGNVLRARSYQPVTSKEVSRRRNDESSDWLCSMEVFTDINPRRLLPRPMPIDTLGNSNVIEKKRVWALARINK